MCSAEYLTGLPVRMKALIKAGGGAATYHEAVALVLQMLQKPNFGVSFIFCFLFLSYKVRLMFAFNTDKAFFQYFLN